MAPPPVCSTARSWILNWRQDRARYNDRFFPEAEARRRFGEANIMQILRCQCSRCQHRRYLLHDQNARGQLDSTQFSDYIHRNLISSFSLLIWLREPAFIQALASSNFTDDTVLTNLGEKECEWHLMRAFEIVRANIASMPSRDEANPLTQLVHDVEVFWTDFLRPRIGGVAFQTVSQRHKLPFFNQRKIGSGISGVVYAFEIFPGYNIIEGAQHISHFARKQRPEPDHEERRVLDRVKALGDPFIAQLLVTYQQRDPMGEVTFNMVFPLATTNLRSYLRERQFGLGQQNYSNIFAAPLWDEIAGILHALNRIHTMDGEYAMHLDLKPENILVDGHHLLITDFGLARLRDPRRYGSGVRDGGGDEAYAPPERDGDRRHDIWSMACILLEVLTFVVCDVEGIKAFDEVRSVNSFWEMLGPEASLRPAIVNHINKLCVIAHTEGNFSVRGRVFVDHLLKLIQWMFSIRKEHRPSAHHVHQCFVKTQKGLAWTASMPSAGGIESALFQDHATPSTETVDIEESPADLTQPGHLVQPAADRFQHLGPEWRELDNGRTRSLQGLLLRDSRHPNYEDTRMHLQIAEMIPHPHDLRLIATFAHERHQKECRGSRQLLRLVPAYALRTQVNNPRHLAGLRIITDDSYESYSDIDIEGELGDLRIVQGVLLGQEIYYSINIRRLVIKRPQPNAIRRMLRKSGMPGTILNHSGLITVQLWRDIGRQPRECRIVIYASTQILIIHFDASWGIQRPKPDTENRVMTTYRNNNATTTHVAILTAFEPHTYHGQIPQPSFALEHSKFENECYKALQQFESFEFEFESATDHVTFVRNYKILKKQWEHESGIYQ